CHLRSGALEAVLGEDLLVVANDPVVDPDQRPVTDRMVVGLEAGMALGVVAHVNKGLSRERRNPDRVEEPARARALLVDRELDVGPAVAVTGGVGSPFGDRG